MKNKSKHHYFIREEKMLHWGTGKIKLMGHLSKSQRYQNQTLGKMGHVNALCFCAPLKSFMSLSAACGVAESTHSSLESI